ncbi:MAG TPA: MBL fold metallo-hydrolase [Gemmataceae bacterium]|jgi:glyoxylase-like metal-dependent hydrolase (beta-lactamase superfamily II)|nr:MBL fold metallo-hydrolase [Gemmataceae bacterium]
MQLHTIVSMPFAENTYIVWQSNSSDAVVIDPGFEPEPVLEKLADDGLTVRLILNTHGHVDHIAGNARMKATFPDAPLAIGVGDAEMLTNPMLNLSGLSGLDIRSPAADRLVREGDVIEAAGLRFEVFDIPGHSPGHVVYLVREDPAVVFGGDVLFRGSIGRTDFPGGDLDRLLAGIRAKLWPLPDDTVVYSGHGPVTTVGHEKRLNPFLAGLP